MRATLVARLSHPLTASLLIDATCQWWFRLCVLARSHPLSHSSTLVRLSPLFPHFIFQPLFMRSTTHRRTQYHDDDDIADPRPWETRVAPSTYGSALPAHTASGVPSESGEALPLFSMDAEKEQLLQQDDSGKWDKGHGAGPGIGGRRGLPPRQRLEGWVSGVGV